ncbi:MAG: hypothetical protein OEV73_05305 [Desulfobulbaceae bacterium]|nr:hypothetical protein [Desulfobulbaceae bacterium]
MTSQKCNPHYRLLSAIKANLRVAPLHVRFAMAVLFATALLLFSVPAIAQENSPEQTIDQKVIEKHLTEILSFARDDGFEYRREGRPDPFAPFISEKKLQAEKSKEQEGLSGLQRLEPGQLTVVAIVFAGKSGYAMVQDSIGFGYVLRKGMRVGMAGTVDAIVPNAVIIKQKYKTISGQTQYRTVEMVLKKEGEN